GYVGGSGCRNAWIRWRAASTSDLVTVVRRAAFAAVMPAVRRSADAAWAVWPAPRAADSADWAATRAWAASDASGPTRTTPVDWLTSRPMNTTSRIERHSSSVVRALIWSAFFRTTSCNLPIVRYVASCGSLSKM